MSRNFHFDTSAIAKFFREEQLRTLGLISETNRHSTLGASEVPIKYSMAFAVGTAVTQQVREESN